MISPIQTPGLRFAAAYHGVLDDWIKDNECTSMVLNFLFIYHKAEYFIDNGSRA